MQRASFDVLTGTVYTRDIKEAVVEAAVAASAGVGFDTDGRRGDEDEVTARGSPDGGAGGGRGGGHSRDGHGVRRVETGTTAWVRARGTAWKKA